MTVVDKSNYERYRAEHPIICGTCWHYDGKRDSGSIGYCYGHPPIDSKSHNVQVKAIRRACAVHQVCQIDIIQIALIQEITAIFYRLSRGD
jgi:hypothetical protein